MLSLFNVHCARGSYAIIHQSYCNENQCVQLQQAFFNYSYNYLLPDANGIIRKVHQRLNNFMLAKAAKDYNIMLL